MITTDAIGRVLAGRYRIDASVGVGSSSFVYLAFDTRLERRVAVKLLHPSLALDAAFLRRFRAESQLVAQLTHPHVLQVFDWGEQAEGPFLVTEYLPGGSLRDLFDRELRLSVPQAVELGAQAAHALAYAHRRGLVHRDIKPANLLLDEIGGLRIADFGIARALAEAALTEPSGAMLGTARYASPEQVQGNALDGRSDVYSLSLVIYEAVTGKVPFAADTTVATLMGRVGAALPYRRELGALYPLLAQATISDPIARFDAGELAVELDTLATLLPRPAPLPHPAPRHAAPSRGPSPDAPLRSARPGVEPTTDPVPIVASRHAAPPTGTTPSRLAPRRHRARRALLVLAVLALLGAGAIGVDRYVIFSHRVPRLVGLSTASAERTLRAAGLHWSITGRAFSVRQAAGDVLAQAPGPASAVRAGAGVGVVISKGPAPVRVPDVRSRTQAAAVSELRGAALGATVQSAYSEHVAPGTVISQSPDSGLLLPGRAVVLTVSKGPSPRTIPDLPGATGVSFAAALRTERLVPVLSRAYSASVPVGAVISSAPVEGAAGIPVGSSVSVVVSRGPQLVAVPNVAGQALAAAVAQLRAAGIDVTEVIGPPFATTAVTTNPAAGTQVPLNSTLTLYAS